MAACPLVLVAAHSEQQLQKLDALAYDDLGKQGLNAIPILLLG